MTKSLRETYEVAHKVLDFPRPNSGTKRLRHILTAPRPPVMRGTPLTNGDRVPHSLQNMKTRAQPVASGTGLCASSLEVLTEQVGGGKA